MLIFYCVVLLVIIPWAYGEDTGQSSAPLFSPTALLIQDRAIRGELKVTEEQALKLDQLSGQINPLLFAMRDVPADTTDPKSIALAERITDQLKEMDHILTDLQRRRLEQLGLQYTGFESLFNPQIQSQLGLTSEQIDQIRQIHIDSLSRQQQLQQQDTADRDVQSIQKQIQKLLFQETQQISRVMDKDQQKQWKRMLGSPFNFSVMKPLTFRAPELQNVTAWMNTKPVTPESLRGRVVVLHFWTFGCSNCKQNYPIYQQWVQKYDPTEVLVLGIHTPEVESEKDLQALKQSIKEHGLSFAVAVDNDKTNWDAWSNRVWPSVYLIDKKGRVRYWWYGELRWQGATGDQWITQCIEQLRAEK